MENIDVKIDGNISAIALPPHGRDMYKRGDKQSDIAPSRVTYDPKFFSDVFLIVLPIGSKDKGINKKKIKETTECGVPVDSGNIPMAQRANMSRRRSSVPMPPKGVSNIRIFLTAVANIIPKIPANNSPTLKITEAVPRADHIGLSPGVPPRSLNQFSVQLNHDAQ